MYGTVFVFFISLSFVLLSRHSIFCFAVQVDDTLFLCYVCVDKKREAAEVDAGDKMELRENGGAYYMPHTTTTDLKNNKSFKGWRFPPL